MRLLQLLALSFATLVTPQCIVERRDSSSAVSPSANSGTSANLLVISAVYGSGTQFDDVTYRVSELLHQPGIEFFARPEWLHADPTPGWNKALVIVYEFKKKRRIFSTGEGGRVSAETLTSNADAQ